MNKLICNIFGHKEQKKYTIFDQQYSVCTRCGSTRLGERIDI